MPFLQKQQGPDLLRPCIWSNFSLQHNINVRWQPRWDNLTLYITVPFLYQTKSVYINVIMAAVRVENSTRVSYALHDTDGFAVQHCTIKLFLFFVLQKDRIFLWQGVISFSKITSQMFSCSHISPSIKSPELTSLWNLSLKYFHFPSFKIISIWNMKHWQVIFICIFQQKKKN